MAFDTKRAKTCKWLEELATKTRAYSKGTRYFSSLNKVFVYCGSMYATDDIILAKVNYPEFEHLSDWEWSQVESFYDENGLLAKTPFLKPSERTFNNDKLFDEMFIRLLYGFESKIDPRVMDYAMKPFKINGLSPNLYTCEDKIELQAHNKDISLKVVMMGVK